ncbi:retrovirus-related pol polyprotein from transposon TNT 1-94 [Tanacetum coccineum]|uniref:Retrovirus-related pol polyprotein from transposon TNT 1-94 n=1 Tax=Tanacetum coccineum TaxID=301880 RepID=A0ABQ5BVG6_9ASTR
MSQSIPEQLNVDRREFADAVNALTKICSSHLVGSGAGIFSSAINPPYKFKWTEKNVLVTEETTNKRTCRSINYSQDIRNELDVEAEVVQIILIGIDNDIYSTVDACPNAMEMWKEIERIKTLRESNIQGNVKNKTGKNDALITKKSYCEAEEAGIRFNVEPANWRDDTDDEPEDQKLEAHICIHGTDSKREHPKQPESVNVTYLKEHGDTNITTDSLDMRNNGGEALTRNDDEDLLENFLKTAQRANPRLYEKGVIPTTSVSRPQLKSNQLEDSVMHNNSQGKKQQVEDHHSTVKFGNDQITPILGYGDLVQGNVTIRKVYYVEGPNHNLFSVGQFCEADLEVAFQKSTCYIRDLKGNDLLTGCTDLYLITLQDTSTPNLIYLMAKATSSQAWLWHRRLSHLNFDTINVLSKYDIETSLTKLKFVKDQLCSSYELGKAKCKSFKTKTTPSSKRQLQILHMDLCSPMRVESFNGKKYVLVIVDDYSRYTWTYFLRSKDETPEVLIDFLKLVQRGLHAQKVLNTKHQLLEYLEQNGVVKRRNGTLVEVARTMLSAAKVPLFFWAEAIATAFLLKPVYSLPLCKLKSSTVTAADTPNQRQQHNPTLSTSTTIAVDTRPLNIQTTPGSTSQAPTQAQTITSTEDINQAETQKENA